MKNILVITSSYDYTIDYLIKKFNNINFYRFNTDLFNNYQIDITENADINIKSLYWNINLQDLNSIYYRKPVFPDLKEYDFKYHSMMMKEIITVVDGIVECFDKTCLTKPSILRKTENKIYQIKLAKKVGFSLGKSLITNSPNHANEFILNNTHNIAKPLSVGRIAYDNKYGYIQTNLLDKSKQIKNIELAPVYFQEYIDKDYEVRVTIINGHVYGVKIETDEKIDWRKNSAKIIYKKLDIPNDIKEKCFAMMNLMNINYGAFDFIVNNNEYKFLEINPNGQWLWLENELNLDISEKLINFLIGD